MVPRHIPPNLVIAALGGRFDADEAEVMERVLREYGGTVPDAQLIEEAGLALAVWRSIVKLHAEAGPIADAPPPTPGREYRIFDSPGSWTRAVAGDSHFADYIERMPLGPVLVTLRFEPNDANKYGVSAYVNGSQVGWLSTELTASDPQVKFMLRLDEAGILPRFQGIHRLTGDAGSHIINFNVPEDISWPR